MHAGLREFLLDLLAFAYPAECLGCERADRVLCSDCAIKLQTPSVLHPGQLDIPLVPVPVYAHQRYAGITRAVLVAYKHGGAFRFSRVLGGLFREPLVAAIAGENLRDPLIIPMPSRPNSTRQRGYRHLEVLLRRAGAQGVRALATTRGRTGQVGLSAHEREQNATRIKVSRFSAAKLAGRDVVLVDDIITTGASVAAACRVLNDAGARVGAVVALCIAERRWRE